MKRSVRQEFVRQGIALAVLVFFFSLALRGAARVRENISDNWSFVLSDEAGLESSDYLEADTLQVVQLPHTWNTKDTFDNVPGYYRGLGWYRKNFAIPPAWAGKRITLRFEAACQVATVWVNNVLMGAHKGAFTPFQFDITDVVRPGQANLVAVRIDNRWRRDIAPYDMDFNLIGGPYRTVWLIATDPVHIVSTRVTTPEVSSSEASVALETEIRNQSGVEKSFDLVTDITVPNGSKLLTLPSQERLKADGVTVVREQTIVHNPQLWSPDQPNLYHVSFSVRENGATLDDEEAPLGFRWYRFDAEKGSFLNGRHMPLRGVNRHDEFPGLGWALPLSRQVKDVELIKQLGANFVRTAHYAQDPSVYDACDRLGLLVWEEVPLDGEGQPSELCPSAGCPLLRCCGAASVEGESRPRRPV